MQMSCGSAWRTWRERKVAVVMTCCCETWTWRGVRLSTHNCYRAPLCFHLYVSPSPSPFALLSLFAHAPLLLLHTQDEVSTDPVIARLEPLPDAEDKSVEVCVRQDARRPYSVRARLGQLMQHSPRIKLAVESGKTAATYRRSGFGQRQTRPTDGAEPYLYDDEVGVLTIDDEWSEKPGQTQHGHLDEEVLVVCMWIWEFIHN